MLLRESQLLLSFKLLMKRYTLGFIFNSAMDKVALMTKNRPDWQKGRLNGTGGHIDEGESSAECIAREVQEEAGITTSPTDWKLAATLGGPGWTMDVYGLVYSGKEEDVKTCTDEEIVWYDLAPLPTNIISNVSWLVPLTLDALRDKTFETVTVVYK